jgi:predicted DCC family thiol-disulfide oxidoreductase YuxK
MTDRLTVFYDGGCPMCSREINHYRRLLPRMPIEWVDITNQPDRLRDYGLALPDVMASFHVMDEAAGRMHIGAHAFVRLWEALPGYRWLARTVSALHLSSVLDRVYRRFAGWHFRRRCRDGACGV